MDLFPREFVLELNTKNLRNSPSFLTITHTTLSTRRFRGYRISTIDITVEFCSGQNSGRTDLQFSISELLKLQMSRIPFQMTTLSDF
jgi:2C-methyl-D-erythritol 2,4-cyclodiphosphate synthase